MTWRNTVQVGPGAAQAEIDRLGPVLAAQRWRTNGDLIADVARLGYLRDTDWVLDATYGRGRFWTKWKPDLTRGGFVAHDLKTDGVDFRHLPHPDRSFDVGVLDGPYKLNGTPALGDFDQAYGVDRVSTWQDRHTLIRDGIAELARVARRIVLVKCQDQVCSGAIRWQTDEFTDWALTLGLVKVDRFDLLGGGRPQPMEGRTQKHAHGRPSTLLVFRCPAREVARG